MDRPLLIKVLLLIAFVLLVVASLGAGGFLITGMALGVAVALGFGGLASFIASQLVAVL
jgi:hypothetical protein